MINIPINEAESIFEAFYDGGESYPNHEKYSPLSEYHFTTAPGTVAQAVQQWNGASITLQQQTASGYGATLERDCRLDITDYDILRLFAAIPVGLTFRIRCIIDGQERSLLETQGLGNTGEYDAPIDGSLITHIALDFALTQPTPASALLEWFGLSNLARQKAMEAKPSPFTSEWTGCFAPEPEIRPLIGLYFSEEELPALRERLSREPFATLVDRLRAIARSAMELEPEGYIQDYIPNHSRRWVRDRDMEHPVFYSNMATLAFIGLLDHDMAMLYMACRKLLSVAVTPYWTESIMGRLPGATWHHRSFTEDSLCTACSLVLDWAGSLLSWHGRNIVYDALMLKGLPRLEADFHSVDYIWEMNQGIVFNRGRIFALLALSHRYPRYEARLQDAAQAEREMVDRYIRADGGTPEGPGYWNYTFTNVMSTVYLLARHAGVSMEEYAWDKLRLTGNFGLSLLSDLENGTYILPINDAHVSQYSPLVTSGFCRISSDPRWKQLYHRLMKDLDSITGAQLLETVLLSLDTEEDASATDVSSDRFISFDTTGHVSLHRSTSDVGLVHCIASGGPNYFAHCHSDRGQFLLEVDHHPLLIDRGMTGYSHPEGAAMHRAYNHNLLFPEAPAGQIAYDQNKHGAGASVLFSHYEDGIFDYGTDTTDSWPEGLFTSARRRIYSPDPHLYVIYDDVQLSQPLAASFRLHTYGTIFGGDEADSPYRIVDGAYQLTVTPLNYVPQRAKMGEDGVDAAIHPVHSLKLYLPEADQHRIATLIEVSPVGQEKARFLSPSSIQYEDSILTLPSL